MRVLDAGRRHLGTAGRPEWEEFTRDPPEGRRLDIRCQAGAKRGEQTLLIRQRDVRLRWEVELNGRSIGVLQPVEYPLVAALAVAVAETPGGAALPCRIMVADGEGGWAPMVALSGNDSRSGRVSPIRATVGRGSLFRPATTRSTPAGVRVRGLERPRLARAG